MDSELDAFYKIGSLLTCTTALGKSVTGYLIAYHLEQKLLLLKIVSSTDNVLPAGLENLNQQIDQQKELKRKYEKLNGKDGSIIIKNCSKNEINRSNSNGTGPPGFEHVQPTVQQIVDNSSDEKFKHDYTLLNLRYISRIEENETQFIDVDKILLSSKMTKTDDSSSNTSKSYTNMIEDGVQPPLDIDISKMTSKLSTRKSEKQSRARLTDLGVTNDAIHLKNFIEKTLGSHENTIHWDQVTGNIIIFDEIQISGPSYDKNSCRFLDGVMNANPQTKKHVDKLIEKFYSDKGKRQKL